MRRWRSLGLVAMLVLPACDEPEYDGIRIIPTDGDADGAVTADGIRLTHGRVMVIDAFLRSSNDQKFDALEQGALGSADGDILSVHPTIYNFGWALVGAGVGQTELEVIVDGVVVDTRPVTVVAIEEEDEAP